MVGDPTGEPTHLVLYDGTCGFCDRSVQDILRADRDGVFRFAPLQGPTAAAIRARHPDLPTDLDSILYVDRSSSVERVYSRADAIFRIAARLPGRRWIAWLDVLPRRLTGAAYDLVARNRHRLAPAPEACAVPTPALRARFLP